LQASKVKGCVYPKCLSDRVPYYLACCVLEYVEAMRSAGADAVLGVASGVGWCVRARKKQNNPISSSTTKDMPRRAVQMTPKDKLGASVWVAV